MGFAGIRDSWRSVADNGQNEEDIGEWELLPATPKYEEELHSGYVKALSIPSIIPIASIEAKYKKPRPLMCDYGSHGSCDWA